MLRYRCFRNDDPPGLVALWNEVFTGRGAAPLRSAGPLERHVFSKPYFDPAGLLLGEDDGRLIGFALAGFGANDDETGLNRAGGVLCALGVAPDHRGRGIGSELLRQSEAYLAARGATAVQAGPLRPLNPFTFGLYGGSDCAGFLLSDTSAAPFLESRGYRGVGTTIVLQRRLDLPIAVPDPRFAGLRRRYDVKLMPRTGIGSWWDECVLGLVEPVEFRLEDKLSGQPLARAAAWEMEGFSMRWDRPAIGLLDVQVRGDSRRLGLARFLLTQIMRELQEQFFGILEVQVPEANQAARALFQSVGFEQVDVGRVYRRELVPPDSGTSETTPG